MSILATISAVTTTLVGSAAKVAGKTSVHTRVAAKLAKLIAIKGKLLAGAATAMLAVSSPMLHAADTSNITLSASESTSGAPKTGSATTAKTTTTTPKVSESTTLVNEADKAGSDAVGFKNDTTWASRFLTAGKVAGDFNPIAGAVLDVIGDAIQLATPKPKTIADKVNDVVRGGELALHDSRDKGSLQTSNDMIKTIAALNALAQADGAPPAVKSLVTAYRAATIAGPATKVDADKAVVVAYENFMKTRGFQISGSQQFTLGVALERMQTVSDPSSERLYSSAVGHFADFLRNSEQATGTPLNDLSKAITAFSEADQSATPLVSAKTVGGDHLFNAAVGLRGYLTAKAANDVPGMAKNMATIVSEGQLAVQAKYPGKYHTLDIDPDAIAAAVTPAPAASDAPAQSSSDANAKANGAAATSGSATSAAGGAAAASGNAAPSSTTGNPAAGSTGRPAAGTASGKVLSSGATKKAATEPGTPVAQAKL